MPPGYDDMFGFLSVLSVVGSVIGIVAPILLVWWLVRHFQPPRGARAPAPNPFDPFAGFNPYSLLQAYNNVINAQVEQQFRLLFEAIQHQEASQIQQYHRNIERALPSLPQEERVVYEHKLSDVVDGKVALNPETGEWE